MVKKEILHIYRRVSTNEQTHKYSLGNQLDSGIKKSKELGMDYQDWNEEGVSGSSENIEDREDGGTPGFLQVIRVSLSMKLKEKMGVSNILKREHELLDYFDPENYKNVNDEQETI